MGIYRKTVRGEGANNAVADIRDFLKRVGPHLPGYVQPSSNTASDNGRPPDPLRKCIDAYEDDI